MTFSVEGVRKNIATIMPSTNASKSRTPSNSLTRIRLSVATSALVLMPVGMLREALEAERREEIQFGGGRGKVANVSVKHLLKYICSL